MSAPSPRSSSSLPLAGVRVLLHIRNDTAAPAPVGTQRGKSVAAKGVLRAARAHVGQLGATLALSEAAADLIVFHGGSPAFLDAAHAKFKAVVCPDYLVACLAADQRVSIAPYVVAPMAAASPPRSTTGDGATATSSPRRRSVGTAASASAAASTRTSGLRSPHRAAAATAAREAAATAPASPRAPTDAQSRGGASRHTPRGRGSTRQSPRAPAAGPSRRLVLLDDDDEEATDGAAQQQRDPTEAPVPPSRKPYLLLDEDEHHADATGSAVHAHLDTRAPPTAAAVAAVLPMSGGEEAEGCSASTQPQQAAHTRRDAQQAVDRAAREAADEEERIRHAVLRSTAGAALTRRRGRPLKPADSAASLDGAGGCRKDPQADEATRGRRRRSSSSGGVLREPDPFLTSTAVDTQPSASAPLPSRTTSTVSLGGAESSDTVGGGGGGGDGCVTQPLDRAEVHCPSLDSTRGCEREAGGRDCLAPVSTARKRPHSSGRGSATGCTSNPELESAQAQPHQGRENQPADRTTAAAPLKRRRKAASHATAAVRRPPCTASLAQPSRPTPRRKRASAAATATAAAPDDAVAVDEPPLAMTFTDTALLRPLTPDSAEAAALCVHIFLDEAPHSAPGTRGVASGSAAASSSAFLTSFLRDVVEQLGATCVVLDDAEDDEDDAGGSCWFKRQRAQPSSRRGWRGWAAAPPPTHLVVSQHAVLTPDLLYYKALGIPIVTPQWLYDAVALGCFPHVVPRVHAHPAYGDGHGKAGTEGCDGDEVGVCREAVTPPPPRRENLLGAEDGEEEDGEAEGGAPPHEMHPSATPTQTSARVVPPLLPARNTTLRRLHQEVADAYVPAGQLARRPFYRPIFADRMFYLHVPPVDLARVHAAPSAPRRSSRAGGGTYLGDVTAALAQVTALVRILGGTVTRNLESTYLDVVLDLTGFYDNLAEAGPAVPDTAATEDRPPCEPDVVPASTIRMLRESLSCAYHDALQRVSQLPGVHAIAAAGTPPSPSEAEGASPSFAVPIVGIPWLVHSVLARAWTATAPFLLPNHVLAAHVAAAHGGAPPHVDAPAPTPPRAAAHADDASHGAVWSALMAAAAAPHRKQACGPHAAIKPPDLQPNTQDAAAMLHDEAPPRRADAAFTMARIYYSEDEVDDDDDQVEVGAMLMQ